MKSIKLITFTALVCFLISCEDDFLETKPLTNKVDENYYSTPEECEEALVGCYAGLQEIWSDGVAMPLAAVVKSNLTFGGGGYTDADDYKMLSEFDASVAPGYRNLFEKNWIFYYRAIYRCNVLIERIDQADWTDKTDMRNQILAEAKFLRAFLYFDLVRMFENIPLLTEPSKEIVPPAEPDEIYKVITNDLLFAVDNARKTTYQKIASSEHGHANKWAAKSLLGRVYLYYTGYYNKDGLVELVDKDNVLGYLENVISYSGYDLVESFYDLWPAAATYKNITDGNPVEDFTESTYAGQTNKEVIFAIKHTYTSDYDGNTDGNHWLVMNGIRGEPVSEYRYGRGWGFTTVVPEIYDEWDPDDDRRDASIIAIEEESINYQHWDNVKEYTGYFTKKYIPLSDKEGNDISENWGAPNFMIGQFQDYFSIRFADVLLMAAELGSPNAVDYVNRVRNRADLDDITSVDIDIIYQERQSEFAFEDIWYWDLLRRDHTLQYAANEVTYEGTVHSGGVETTKTVDGQNLINTRGLFQIPYNQITLSDGVLEQNDGW